MSIKVAAWVWDHAPVSGTELLLMLAIADQANDDGTDSWPSVQTLARRTRLNERTVQRLVQRLVAAGRLKVEHGGGRRHNRYSIVMPDTDGRPADAGEPLAARHPRRTATGDRDATPGATQPSRGSPGTAASPDTSFPVHSPTTAPDTDRDRALERTAEAIVERLRSNWRINPADRERLRPKVMAALAAGIRPEELNRRLSEHPHGARFPFAVLAARLHDLATAQAELSGGSIWPQWCGGCDGPDPHQRMIITDAGRLTPCPNCHPRGRSNGQRR